MTHTLTHRSRDARRALERAQRRADPLAREPRSEADGPSPALAWPMLLLFVSGTASLVYQVLWVKQLSLVVGVDVHAVTTGVSAFFAGLALGSCLFGRLADRLARPLLLYAWLEGGVLLSAVAATFALARAAAPFVWLQQHLGLLAWVLPFALVGLPAVLIGGTLPALMRASGASAGRLGRTGARLYAANTAGAVAGTLAAAFVLIPSFGVQGSALAAAVLNGVAALIAVFVARMIYRDAGASAPSN